MNQRIRLLAEQSGFYFYDLHNIDGQDYGETIEADSWNAAEKFANLIVYDFLDELTNDGSLGEARIATIRRLAEKWGVAR